MLETISTRSNKPAARVLASGMTLFLAVVVVTALHSQSAAQDQPTHEMEMKAPETAKDHSAMAEHYKKVEAEAREDIAAHEKMLAEFKKGAVGTTKMGENPHVKEERLHCEKYIKAAQAFAAEAAESAKFHSLRAKEMEGK